MCRLVHHGWLAACGWRNNITMYLNRFFLSQNKLQRASTSSAAKFLKSNSLEPSSVRPLTPVGISAIWHMAWYVCVSLWSVCNCFLWTGDGKEPSCQWVMQRSGNKIYPCISGSHLNCILLCTEYPFVNCTTIRITVLVTDANNAIYVLMVPLLRRPQRSVPNTASFLHCLCLWLSLSICKLYLQNI